MAKSTQFRLIAFLVTTISLIVLLGIVMNRHWLADWWNGISTVQFQTNSQTLRVRMESNDKRYGLITEIGGDKLVRLPSGTYSIDVSASVDGEWVSVEESIKLDAAEKRVINVEFQLVQSRAQFQSRKFKSQVSEKNPADPESTLEEKKKKEPLSPQKDPDIPEIGPNGSN